MACTDPPSCPARLAFRACDAPDRRSGWSRWQEWSCHAHAAAGTLDVMTETRFDRIDRQITAWMAGYGVFLLRIALGVVFLWFGALKLVPGLSPAEDLAGRTIEALTFGIVPASVALPILALWEVAIGVGLLVGRWMRVTLLLLFVQMAGTVTPLFLFPSETFVHFPFVPTLEGQYIIKNIVLVAAAIVLGATVRGGELTPEPIPPGRQPRLDGSRRWIRALVRELKNAEDARFRDEHPRSIELAERARGSMPNGVPMAWFRSSYHHVAPWVVEGHGVALHGRGRPHLSRLQHRGHVDVLWLRAGTARPRRQRPDRARQPVPAADRGRDRRLRGARGPVSACRSGSTRSRRARPTSRSIRVARVATGRDKVLLFDGHYLGHFDETLVELDDDGRVVPEERGVPAAVAGRDRARATQRPCRAGAGAGAARHRARPDRAGTDQQPRSDPAGPGLARRAARADPARTGRCSPSTRRTPRSWGRAG